jgi:hypothetical protein
MVLIDDDPARKPDMKTTSSVINLDLRDTRKLSSDWLIEFGWVPRADGRWRRATPWGEARLQQVMDSAHWAHYLFEGGAVRIPTPGTYLRRHQDMVGPFKFVRVADGRIACRGDVPHSATSSAETTADVQEITQSTWPWQWLRRAIDLVEGLPGCEAPALDPAATVAWLEQHGRTASRDGERILVHMSLSGCFAQIICQRHARLGFQLRTELISLENLPPRVQRAMLRFVAEANDRLPLARFVVSDTCPSHLACEISLGSVLIPGTWFSLALAAMEAAVTHTYRELLALRDSTLARRYLAATTA